MFLLIDQNEIIEEQNLVKTAAFQDEVSFYILLSESELYISISILLSRVTTFRIKHKQLKTQFRII